ncbi:transcriptional regulator family: Fungal Specific TF [Penicillium verhagenii]|uniref:transcriptional regulator family: Fungal Specific TF n=1 Tax=Penicillium verhagenii TaxID=1562060 RepID=UPI00254505AC|nr:transcriptional regulator family: Fungal Specific TF [Penicillium verhagenii]KAJ5930042.1 transcriptional regulator family: Fungal Specific TF [Penicillium verhagenii]
MSRPFYQTGPLGSTPETPTTATEHDDDDDESSSSELGDAAGRDGLSGVNLHTKGTEFYGNSSNLAFLGNLFARAQHQSEGRDSVGSQDIAPRITTNRPQPSSPENRSTPGKSQLSIVNLLYNADYTGHPSPQSYDGAEGGPNKTSSYAKANAPGSAAGPINNHGAQTEIEKIFIGSYFTNKHYIHPILSKGAFMRRCEREAWPISRRAGLFRSTTKFAGLYFAVVALGAINASPNETALLDHFYQQSADPERVVPVTYYSALDFAKFYFGIAKIALGDLFESSCLETAQALFLLSVFRQNSLQPHSCYMYSGMAVRTAAAIGLASSMSSLPPSRRREAKRTWCLSSEIEGKRKEKRNIHATYGSVLTKPQIHYGDLDPDAEDNDVAMIPVMVSLAQIMSEASHQLYHSAQRSLSDKSRLAMGLDRRLQEWKSNIPAFLNLDARPLSDPEWAFKQKLVLRLRYYNTRILIHKPFLVASTTNAESAEFQQHLHICLEAARMSIKMQYESFMHRIYIRTWWYNTTYALYGSMILLHLILSNFPGLPDEELLEDVEKSLEIFSSMDDIIVARRCAEMLREVLEVARACLARRRQGMGMGIGIGIGTAAAAATPSASGSTQAHQPHTQYPSGLENLHTPSLASHSSSHPLVSASASADMLGGGGSKAGDFALPRLSFDAGSSLLAEQGQGGVGPDDEDFFFSLFSQDSQQQQRDERTRAEMLANLVDPSILEDFAFGGQEFSLF